jgi:uncharacterized tellurite resistance protein B-like protein
MFLYNLTNNQKKAFLSLAKRLIAADGRLAKEEMILLSLMAKEMDIVTEEEMSKKNLPELLKEFDTRKAQVSILLELIYLCYIDNEFRIEENEFMQNIISMFGVSQEEMLTFKNWVLKYLSLMKEANEFWGSK